MGIAPRAEIGTPDQAQRYLDLGVIHFCMGTDMSVLFNWFKNEGEALRKIFGDQLGKGGAIEAKGSPDDPRRYSA